MFQKKARLLSLLIPLLLILAFLSITTTGARRAPWYEQMIWNLLTPPQAVFSRMGRFASHVWQHYFYLVDVEKQNETLRFQVAKFQGEQMKTLEVENENQRLRQLLAYKQNFPYEAIVASVIANDPRSEFKSIVIDKGASDGIVPLMPVVGPQGLVGRVGNVAAGTSRVLLITDPNSAVDVLVQRSRARGLVVGTAGKTGLRPGYYLTRIEYLRRVSDIRDGDAVVTSGFDRVFPSGIPVGSISDLVRSKHGVFLDANIVPFENMAELQDVMVLLIRVEEIPPVQGLREGN